MHVKSLTTFAVVCLTLSTQALAETLIVPEKYSTIQEAINAATNGDTVVVKPGIYHGAGNRDISLEGKTITVKSQEGPDKTIIDCGSNHSAEPHSGFIFNKGEWSQSVLDGFTIMHGQALTQAWYNGGAISIIQSSPTIRNCVFIRNKAKGKGGALSLYESEARIEDCIFRQNEANQGGALAVVNSSDPLFSDLQITQNTAYEKGAGIYLENNDNATFDNTFISENNAQIQGGGAAISGGALKMSNSILRQNWAKEGAGVYSQEAAAFLTNVVANKNRAHIHAGMVFEGDSTHTVRLINTTIADNFSQSGGTIFYGEGLRTLSIENSILWNNFPFGIEDNTGLLRVRYSNIEEGWDGEGNIQANPLFTDSSRNNFSLRDFSPAIDAADGDKAPQMDAAGMTRYDDQSVTNTGSGRVNYADMGAFERQEDSRQIESGKR